MNSPKAWQNDINEGKQTNQGKVFQSSSDTNGSLILLLTAMWSMVTELPVLDSTYRQKWIDFTILFFYVHFVLHCCFPECEISYDIFWSEIQNWSGHS